MKRVVSLWMLLAVCAVETAAAEPVIYRCGNSYSEIPCPQGKTVDAGKPPDAAEQARAKALASRERHDASRLEAERHKREAESRPAVAFGFDSRPTAIATLGPAAGATRKAKGSTSSKRAAVRASDSDFVAVSPSVKKPKKQANPGG